VRVHRWCSAAVLAGLALVVAACGDDGPSRTDVLGDYANDVALPRYQRLAATADDLVAAVGEACAAPSDETVRAGLDAVGEARSSWLSTAAMPTGPIMERRSEAVIDWPVRVADIERLISGSAPGDITANVIANNVGADTRGLSALDLVLSTDDVVDRLGDQRWCDYVTATTEVVAAEAHLLLDDWTVSFAEGAPFVDVLAEDAGNTWVGMIVNDSINVVHMLTEAPDDAPDGAANVASDRATQLDGLGEIVTAIGPLLGDELAGRLAGEVDAAQAAFTDGDVDGGRALTGEVEATLATEVASRLGVTIGFSDADGDSAG